MKKKLAALLCGVMCVGAFSSAFCTKLLQDSIQNEVVLFLIAIAVGTVAAAFFGFLIGIPVLRLRGDYLAIVTLAFGEIIKNVINVLYIAKDENGFHFAISDGNKIELSEEGIWLINGAKGIAKIPHLSSFTAGVIMILVILFIVYNFVNSRTGRAVMAIRDNRIAAESVGINITKFKLMAFTISAAIAGAGGVLYAHNLSTVTATPTNFGYNMSIMILVFRRHGKLPWIDHCSSHFNTASGGAPWTEGLSYVDLFHRSDRNDAFQLGTKMY